jgi:O-antigen ligase
MTHFAWRFSTPTRAILLATGTALWATHGGEFAILSLAPLLLLLGWCWKTPTVGALALLPLVYIIHPTPTALGWRELAFAATCVVLGLATLRDLPRPLYRKAVPLTLLVTLFLVVNLATAQVHGVPTANWLRGLAPFLFILYCIPVWHLAMADQAFRHQLFWAACMASLLFGLHVILTYVDQRLWEPSYYLLKYEAWTRVNADQVGLDNVHPFKIRVTQVLQTSTDLLVPIGAVWGTGLYIVGRAPMNLVGLLLAAVSTAAVTLTYTRSMLLTIVIACAALIGYAIYQRRGTRALLASLLLAGTFVTTVAVTDLGTIYRNRIFQTTQFIAAIIEDRVGDNLEALSRGEMDANILTRLDEYRIAWRKFLAAPIAGQGLGTMHTIYLDEGGDNLVEHKVGYIHNWVLYILMTAGILGLLCYGALLATPALIALVRYLSVDESALIFITVASMALYGLFFAVFRLIPFNLVLGALLGIALAARTSPDRPT